VVIGSPPRRSRLGSTGDAVDIASAPRRDDAPGNVAPHQRRVAFERITVATAALPGVEHDIAWRELELRHLGLEQLDLAAQALDVQRREQIVQGERQPAAGVEVVDARAPDDQLAVADAGPAAELAEGDGHFDAVSGDRVAQPRHAVRRPGGARRTSAAQCAVAAGVREEGAKQKQQGAVHLVRLDVGDVRARSHQRAGLVDAVADRAGAAPADLGIDQLCPVRLIVLIAVAAEQRREGPMRDRA
jgi:hypothetical protein